MRRTRTIVGLVLTLVVGGCSAEPPATPTVAPGSDAPTAGSSLATSPGPSQPARSTGPTPTEPQPTEPQPTEPEPSPGPATSSDLISAALDDGRIDVPTEVLYRMFAVFGDPRLPAEFQGAPSEDDLAPFTLADDPDIPLPDDVRAQLAPYLLRPADPASAFFGADEPAATNLFEPAVALTGALPTTLTCDANGWTSMHAAVPMRIWARCTGNYEADIATAVSIANEIYGPETQYMGGPPVPDSGGLLDDLDTSIDVFLSGETACPPDFGRCFVVPDMAGGFAKPTEYGTAAGAPTSGYIVIRRARLSDLDYFRGAFIHELFHILQFSKTTAVINGPTGRADKNGAKEYDNFWFIEASAKWAEYHFEVQLGYTDAAAEVARDWFTRGYQWTDASLDAKSPGLHRYQAYIWPFFMNQEVGPKVIADVWNDLQFSSDFSGAMDVIDGYLPFYSNFRVFAVRNINTDVSGGGTDPIPKRYQALDPSVSFPNGTPRGPQWLGPSTIEPTQPDLPEDFVDNIQPLSAHYWHLNIGDDVERFEFDFSGLGSSDSLDVDALLGIRTNGAGSALRWEHRLLSDPKQKFCRSVADEDVQEMYLVLTNHEKDPLPLNGHFTVEASATPCHGFDVTITHETTGGPWDPAKMTVNVVIEPEEVDGQPTGLFEGYGHVSGSWLHGEMGPGCINDTYNGVAYMTGSIQGDDLSVDATPTDPLGILAFYGGVAPKKGGTTTVTQPPVLQPGEQGSGLPSCEAYSQVTDTVTVKPLDPQP